VQKTYVYGPDRISQTIVRGATRLLTVTTPTADVRLLMDGTGAVTDTYDYDAWGNLIASTGTTPNFYLYQGEQIRRGEASCTIFVHLLRSRLSGRFLTASTASAIRGATRLTCMPAPIPVNGHDPTGEQDLIETHCC